MKKPQAGVAWGFLFFEQPGKPGRPSAEATECGAKRVCRATGVATRAVATGRAIAAAATAVAVAATAAQRVDAGAQRVGLSASGGVQARLTDAHAAQVCVGAGLALGTFFAWTTVFTWATGGAITARAAGVA